MKTKLEKIYNVNVVKFFIIMLPLVEVITSIIKWKEYNLISFGVIYKAIFIVYSIIYLILYNTFKKRHILYILLGILLYVITNTLTVGATLYALENLCIFITFVVSNLFFFCYIKSGNILKLDCIVYSALLYCFFILIAVISKTGIPTYEGNIEFGTTGWYFSGNELSSILSMLLPITLYMAAKKTKPIYVVGLFLHIYTLLSLGTKTSFAAVLIIIILSIILAVLDKLFIKSNLVNRLLIISSLALTFYLIILPNTASYKYLIERIDNKAQIHSTDLSETKLDKGSFIFNGREIFLKEQKELFSSSSITERLFGLKPIHRLKIDNSTEVKLLELDLFDTMCSYGIIGFMLIYLPIIYTLINMFYYIIYHRIKDKVQLLSFLGIAFLVGISISTLAGHVILTSTVGIFLAYVIASLNLYNIYEEKLDMTLKENMKRNSSKARKKILICTPRISIGGMERAYINLLNLSNILKNYEVWAYVQYIKDAEYLKYMPENINLHVVCKGAWTPANKVKTVFKILIDIFNAPKFDAAICFGHNNGFLARLTRRASKNNVIFIHADLKSRTKKQLNKLNSFVKFEKFNKVVCVSNKAKESYMSFFKNHDVRVINNYIDAAKILKESDEPIEETSLFKDDLITFVNICRQEELSKKLSRVIEACSRLKEENYKFQMLLIGDGPDTKLYEDMVKDKNLEDIVIFLGKKINPYPYIKKSDALVFSSIYEGYGIVLDEARLLGVPFISTDVADAKAIASLGYGTVCENSEHGIYASMKDFLDNGYKLKEPFDYTSFNDKITNELDKLLEVDNA